MWRGVGREIGGSGMKYSEMKLNRDTFFARGEWELEIEGCTVRVDPDQNGRDLEEGDLYVAQGNGDPELLECKRHGSNFVFPADPHKYPYDYGQCRKVVEIDGQPIE